MSRREKSYCACGQQKSEKKKRCWDCEDHMHRARKHSAYHRRIEMPTGSGSGTADQVPTPRSDMGIAWAAMPATRAGQR